jgi:hypothetical protein
LLIELLREYKLDLVTIRRLADGTDEFGARRVYRPHRVVLRRAFYVSERAIGRDPAAASLLQQVPFVAEAYETYGIVCAESRPSGPRSAPVHPSPRVIAAQAKQASEPAVKALVVAHIYFASFLFCRPEKKEGKSKSERAHRASERVAPRVFLRIFWPDFFVPTKL